MESRSVVRSNTLPGIDRAVEDELQQLGLIGAGRGRAATHADVAVEGRLAVDLDIVWDADPADDRTGRGDGERGVTRVGGADAFEHRVGAEAVRELLKLLDRRLAAGFDDVGGTPFAEPADAGPHGCCRAR